MDKLVFRLPSRIPQLYFGASVVPRKKSQREKLADVLYFILLAGSYILFIIGGVVGYLYSQIYGLILCAMLGFGIGLWIRRSLGIRGRTRTAGFFSRMRERAQGAKPGLLETWVESLSGYPFTQAKCRVVTTAREKAVKQLKQSNSTSEKNHILAELDKNVQRILFG